MKIKILYSHLNVSGTDNKQRPVWFDFEKCFKNMISTNIVRGNLIHLIYDETRGMNGANWIHKYSNFYKIHNIIGGSMFGAAKEMYRIAKELSSDMEDNDIFYFCENDYLHLPDWGEKLIELSSTFNLNSGYVSTYDHSDKYTHPMYEELTSKLFVVKTHHWRTTPSTCGTYAVNKKTFLEDYDVLTTLEGDHNKFIKLQEDRGRFILSPILGLSTHCMEGLLSPCIDWEKINNNS